MIALLIAASIASLFIVAAVFQYGHNVELKQKLKRYEDK